MTQRLGLACAIVLGAVPFAGCSHSGSRSSEGERASEARAPIVIAPNRTEVFVYENPDGTDDLPFHVPVVVSSTSTAPSVVFRIACGASYGRVLEGFGYPPDLDLDSADHYASLDSLMQALRWRAPDAGDLPIVTLTCSTDNEVLRRQITQVYRMIDADPSKGEANYYLRFRDDPGGVYTLGCANFVRALGWDGAPTVPINRVVLDTWASLGLTRRELNCYEAQGRPMPAPDKTLPVVAPSAPTSNQAKLYRVRYSFDGIGAPMPLYLITNGLGYALDCGANQRGIKAALGFSQTDTVPELSTSSAEFLDSAPGKQPHLRCLNPGTTIFEPLDESPASQYFRFGGTNGVFQFTCDLTRAFFADGVSDVRKIPRESVGHLFPDANEPGAGTKVYRVGCNVGDSTAPRAGGFATVGGRRAHADGKAAVHDDGFELGGRVCTTAGLRRVCLVGGFEP